MNLLNRLSRGAAMTALSATLLAACGGGDGGYGSTSTGGAACTGDALAFFTKNAGSYPSTATIIDGSGTVAGIADKAAASVVIGADCSVKVGDASLMYKDASLKSYSDQINVNLTGTNFTISGYEVFGNGSGLLTLSDVRTNSVMGFGLPKK